MHAAVAVAIRHVEVTLRTHGNVGGAVEGATSTRVMVMRFLPSYPVSDGVFITPRVMSSLPSGVNCRTVWLPSSVQKIVPLGPTEMPWVRAVNSPSPHERRKLPR